MPYKAGPGRPKGLQNKNSLAIRLKLIHQQAELDRAIELERLYKMHIKAIEALLIGVPLKANYYDKSGLVCLIEAGTPISREILEGIPVSGLKFLPLDIEIEDKLIKLIAKYEARVANIQKIKCPICGADK